MKRFLILLAALAALPAVATRVEFPLKSFFNGANYTKGIKIEAVHETLTDGTNLYAGSLITLTPSGGTNPVVNLQPNDYTITFADVRVPLRFAVPYSDAVLNVVDLITNGLSSYYPSSPGGGGITNGQSDVSLNAVNLTNLTVWGGADGDVRLLDTDELTVNARGTWYFRTAADFTDASVSGLNVGISEATATNIAAWQSKIATNPVAGWISNAVPYLDAKTGFGAVGDGATDDTAALQAAFNALANANGPRTLRLPSGRYRVTDTLTVPQIVSGYGYAPVTGPITIAGDGWGNTLIVSESTTKPALSFVSPSSQQVGLTFQNFGILGPLVSSWNTAYTAQGIIGGWADSAASGGRAGADMVNFEGLYVSGFAKGMAMSNVWAPTFTRCLFTSNRLAGIELMDCHYTTVEQCGINGYPGRETGRGLSFYPAGGVQATVQGTVFIYCTNAIFNGDVTLTAINCEFENCGTAAVLTNGVPATFIGCGFSELFGTTGIYSVTNGHPGMIEAYGVSARTLMVIAPVIENDGATPARRLFGTFASPGNYFGFSGTNFYAPNLLNYPGPYLTGWWNGTNGYNVYPIQTTAPIFNGAVILTNQPTRVSGGAHGLTIQDGNFAALKIGGDADQGSALTGGNSVNKVASIVAPNVYDGLYTTTLLGWSETTGAGGYGGLLGIGGNANFTDSLRNAPAYIDFFTKAFVLPPAAGTLRWRIDESGTLASQNGSSLNVGTGTIKTTGAASFGGITSSNSSVRFELPTTAGSAFQVGSNGFSAAPALSVLSNGVAIGRLHNPNGNFEVAGTVYLSGNTAVGNSSSLGWSGNVYMWSSRSNEWRLANQTGTAMLSVTNGSMNLSNVVSTAGYYVNSNSPAAWPASAAHQGQIYFGNSNGVLYVLTTGASTAWGATNKIAP